MKTIRKFWQEEKGFFFLTVGIIAMVVLTIIAITTGTSSFFKIGLNFLLISFAASLLTL